MRIANRVTESLAKVVVVVMVDDDALREERQKHKEDDPPRVRQCVTSMLPFFSFSFRRTTTHKTPAFYSSLFFFLSHRACLIVSFLFSLSLSLLVHQMAPSIRAAKVLGNLAKINERAILGAEVTPGLCQARNI